MARARNIKPGLFTNEVLVDLPAFDRLLFIGLWCLADREGRLEDRVKRIKMELFPCDNYDIELGLNNLAGAGFITRYTSEGYTVIEVNNFTKHQNPHGSEKDSDLPDVNGFITVNERRNKLIVKGSCRKVHVKELLNTVTTPLGTITPPLLNALIPDSGFLIPEEDQNHSLGADENFSPAKPDPNPTTDEFLAAQSEPAHDPVNPKTPVEMTLDWMPDANLLQTYCVHFGVSADLFTKKAVAPFTAHHQTEGALNTQAKWVSLLVRWVKSDSARTSNVRQFPAKPRTEDAYDDEDTTWLNQESTL